MFISALDLYKIGIGPSSSHTMGPMFAAKAFREQMAGVAAKSDADLSVRCFLRGSLAFTGEGHATDRAVALGLHGYVPIDLANVDVSQLVAELWDRRAIDLSGGHRIAFDPAEDIVFDRREPLPQHPNGMIFELRDASGEVVFTETYFSIGGGFIDTLANIDAIESPIHVESASQFPYPFDSANSMLEMAQESGLSIARMKRANELVIRSAEQLDAGLDQLWSAMSKCLENGLAAEGQLPGKLKIPRRAKNLFEQFKSATDEVTINDWLCAYAMAVNEENAAGHMVVTAPTNGAAGVIPAALYYLVHHGSCSREQVHDFLLTSSAIGGLIKHRSSISGAEVGCQGEVGSASAMAAAGICEVRGGTPKQVENAAEIALEHHLGMTCDPVAGLVQVPCIERNGFGVIKAFAAASLAKRGTGEHFMPLDSCIEAMKQTGLEMSNKYKETSLGGLAVSITEC